MIKVLVVDDNVNKINDIVAEIKKSYGESQVSIETAIFANDAKRILKRNSIDILILDICLPEIAGGSLIKDAGIKLLKQIKGAVEYTYPRYVIALSAYEELAKEFDIESGMIHTSLLYDVSTNEWRKKLSNSIRDFVSILTQNIDRRSYDYDVAVICALGEELALVKASLDNIKNVSLPDDDYIYIEGTFKKEGVTRRVVMAQSTHMGMVPAATLTTRLIYNFAPRYVVMTGITAGIKGKANFGDVIAAEYTWDYGAGKEVVEDEQAVHRNTIDQIHIDTDVATMIRKVSADGSLLQSIKNGFMGTKPETELKVVMGPVASGASVIANPQVVESIKNGQIRDTVGVEMEIFGVYYASRWSVSPKPKFIALKSVCDFADSDKNDNYHAYASYTSAKLFLELATKYFEYE
ncbi:Nucleoside phosphorylase [Eubacterium ruminantium]|uniref:Stage 0 sporulation protein A homolog n=1 Tax=Eubacterium ruminantium TaxID=42322 RepID=A0A1T4MWW5_9FIRM|nr:response regulator [Eubacterium ruminantium]SCW50867.1 Nucleoside phosphorylase [Eubacterium ruminantium]SDM69670.1 Nucleoside phosphorylase [Eubacterium ruminantium]SJZ71580.1 Nucleoside phosphorylase [Eubacterium ruminantium]